MLPMRSSVASASTDEIAPAKAPDWPTPPRASAHANAATMTPDQAAPATSCVAIRLERVGAIVAAPAAAAATSAATPITRAGGQRFAASESGSKPRLKPIQNTGESSGILSAVARRR